MTAPERAPGEVRRVVGVGSSAGGLEALRDFLGAVEVGVGCAFVVAQHVSPKHESALVGLLDPGTPLQVVIAVDGQLLEPDVVHVAPPGCDVTVDANAVRVVASDDRPRPTPSVDRLLRSIADGWGDRSIAVVLSGTGTDGAAGVQAVHAAGGLVVAETRTRAAFEGMPEAAVLTGAVDLVLEPEEIGPALARVLEVPDAPEGEEPAEVPVEVGEVDVDGLDDVIAALKVSVGMDFGEYKRSTLVRQVGRRRRMVDAPDLVTYAREVADDPEEARAVASMLLVTVTSFFRDPQVWESVARRLRDVVDAAGPGHQLRLWVAGCATGEEAYTLAMVAADVLGSQGALAPRLKVFATDLDERSLETARTGRYLSRSVADVPERLRDRWMQEVGDHWEIVPELRECTVFARHDVAVDPPFPRIDVISLRNTMIYFQPSMQERVLRLCQFALAPGGLLVLGESERVAHTDAYFVAVDPGERIYRRRDHVTGGLPLARTPLPRASVAAAPVSERPRAVLERSMLRALVPPTLVLDADDDVVEVIGDVAPWCWVAEGRRTSHVVALLREPFRPAVRTLLVRLRSGEDDRLERLVTVGTDVVKVAVSRLAPEVLSGEATVVSFLAQPSVPAPKTPPAGPAVDLGASPELASLAAELESTQVALQSTIEELSSSNEELQAMNEELQASSEELQASSEEVQASNEELEATNEELATLNQELQVRTGDLGQANTDLENIQGSLTSGLVLVDRDLRVTRFTPLAVRLFSLIREDVGRPLPAVPTTLAVPDLEARLQEAVDDRVASMLELPGADQDLLLQIQPYQTASGAVRGAIVVVIDVSERASARRAADRGLRNFAKVTDAVREVVWQRDRSGELVFVNARIEDLYGLARDAVLGDPSLLLAVVHPDDRDRVAAAYASTTGQWAHEFRVVRPDGEVRWVEETAVSIEADELAPSYVVGSAIDVTDRHLIAQRAREHERVLDAVMDNDVVGVIVMDDDDRILRASRSFAEMVGYEPSALVGTPLSLLVEPPDVAATGAGSEPNASRATASRLVSRSGEPRPITIERRALGGPGGVASGGAGSVAIVHDVTHLRALSASLAAQGRFDHHTGLLTREFFRAGVEERLVTSSGSALLWIDLDGFKEVNDRFGHQTGDVVLTAVARRLQAVARRDDLVGRLGGDEFALFVGRIDVVDSLEAVAERVLSTLRVPIPCDGAMVYVSGSVGIAVSPDDGTDADTLLHNADTAMYSAKKAGRDRHVYFSAEMNAAADTRAAMRQALAAAVREQAFELYYQPIVGATTGEVVMVEALLRWHHDGRVSAAAEFIDLAAETGQLRALGRIVLTLADADLHVLQDRWGDERPAVAINLSAPELEERATLEQLVAWDPPGGYERLVVEVTESILLERGGRAYDTLTMLRRLGATVSIDDFGSGYSSFDLLATLSPSVIKIDRTLLELSRSEGPHHQLFEVAVQLGEALGARVVAEGVEDEASMDHVRSLGVDLAQGYHLARPMPLPDLVRWLEERR